LGGENLLADHVAKPEACEHDDERRETPGAVSEALRHGRPFRPISQTPPMTSAAAEDA
jgi:hypothetical protein